MLVRLLGSPGQTAQMRNQAVPDGLYTQTSTPPGLDNRGRVVQARLPRRGAQVREPRSMATSIANSLIRSRKQKIR